MPKNGKPSRAERKALRQKRREEKAVRLKERPEVKEAVRMRMDPASKKGPRRSEDPKSIMQLRVTWSDQRADRSGSWTWGPREWDSSTWSAVIYPKLEEWEKLKWSEVCSFTSGSGHYLHHSQDLESIVKEARERWQELEIDADEAFRFRLGSTRRLWGYRIGAHFQVLWWDPDHNIYPTEPN